MKNAGEFQRAVLLGAEGLPLVFKDVILPPSSALPISRFLRSSRGRFKIFNVLYFFHIKKVKTITINVMTEIATVRPTIQLVARSFVFATLSIIETMRF